MRIWIKIVRVKIYETGKDLKDFGGILWLAELGKGRFGSLVFHSCGQIVSCTYLEKPVYLQKTYHVLVMPRDTMKFKIYPCLCTMYAYLQ